MQAWRLVEPKVARLEEIPVPEPGPGEVLLRVAGAGVCHSDLHLLHAPRLAGGPATLGHEVSGFVERTGDGVSDWRTGTPVVAYLCWGCGSAEHARRASRTTARRTAAGSPPVLVSAIPARWRST